MAPNSKLIPGKLINNLVLWMMSDAYSPKTITYCIADSFGNFSIKGDPSGAGRLESVWVKKALNSSNLIINYTLPAVDDLKLYHPVYRVQMRIMSIWREIIC
jgi:hypothetical protein